MLCAKGKKSFSYLLILLPFLPASCKLIIIQQRCQLATRICWGRESLWWDIFAEKKKRENQLPSAAELLGLNIITELMMKGSRTEKNLEPFMLFHQLFCLVERTYRIVLPFVLFCIWFSSLSLLETKRSSTDKAPEGTALVQTLQKRERIIYKN